MLCLVYLALHPCFECEVEVDEEPEGEALMHKFS